MEPRGDRRAGPLDGRSLAQIAEVASGCRLCRLCDSRTHVVFGRGSAASGLMFVTEAPGYHEDRLGLPLAGEAAALFARMLREVQVDVDEVYVTSVVKCRPPRNRTPFPDEIEQCEGYLFHEVAHIRPLVVCALGNVAIRLLTGRPHQLSKVHGRPMRVVVQGRDLVILPLYHPSAVVHSPRLEAALRNDLRQLPRLLRQGADAVPAPPPVAPAPTVLPREPAVLAGGTTAAVAQRAQEQMTFDIG